MQRKWRCVRHTKKECWLAFRRARLLRPLPRNCRNSQREAGCSASTTTRANAIFPYRTFCPRSEEHTSELQSLMRNSYAVFCLKKKKTKTYNKHKEHTRKKII